MESVLALMVVVAHRSSIFSVADIELFNGIIKLSSFLPPSKEMNDKMLIRDHKCFIANLIDLNLQYLMTAMFTGARTVTTHLLISMMIDSVQKC